MDCEGFHYRIACHIIYIRNRWSLRAATGAIPGSSLYDISRGTPNYLLAGFDAAAKLASFDGIAYHAHIFIGAKAGCKNNSNTVQSS